jgi:hypothetical protein
MGPRCVFSNPLKSGMDDLFLNRMLFEWLGDRWKEQAHSEILSLKEFKMMNLTYFYFKNSFLCFLYEPLPRVLSASGVIMRFKKRLSMERLFGKTPRPLIFNITPVVPYSMVGVFLFFARPSNAYT